jgi:hypothetical protein
MNAPRRPRSDDAQTLKKDAFVGIFEKTAGAAPRSRQRAHNKQQREQKEPRKHQHFRELLVLDKSVVCIFKVLT